MSHIIIDRKLEEIEHLLEESGFKGKGAYILLRKKGDFELPVVVAGSKQGCVLRVENGEQHLEQEIIQEALVEAVAEIRKHADLNVLRCTISRRLLRKYGIPYTEAGPKRDNL